MKKLNIILNLLVIAFIISAIYLGDKIFFPQRIPGKTYQLIIEKDQSLRTLSSKLYSDRIISDDVLFRGMLRLLHKDKKVTAGLYVLNNSMSMWRLILRITNGKPDEISISILSGWNINQLRSYVDSLDNIKHLTIGMSNLELQNNLKLNMPGLEGIFYPTTYFIAPGQTDLEIYQQSYKLMQSKLANLFAKRSLNTMYKSPYQLLIMASLIEKETGRLQDMFLIATVFNNRLKHNMKLQDDPAVFYGLGNKKIIKRIDFRIDTPYNTYIHYGLPPTPICIPSENALLAASMPANNPKLLYFLAIGNGNTRFSATYGQHLHLIKQHLN